MTEQTDCSFCKIAQKHYDYFDDLPLELATNIMELGQHLAKALKQITGVERVAFLFTGGDILHAHAHLVPMYEKTDITSRRYILNEDLTFQDRPHPPHDEQLAILRKIKEAMSVEHL